MHETDDILFTFKSYQSLLRGSHMLLVDVNGTNERGRVSVTYIVGVCMALLSTFLGYYVLCKYSDIATSLRHPRNKAPNFPPSTSNLEATSESNAKLKKATGKRSKKIARFLWFSFLGLLYFSSEITAAAFLSITTILPFKFLFFLYAGLFRMLSLCSLPNKDQLGQEIYSLSGIIFTLTISILVCIITSPAEYMSPELDAIVEDFFKGLDSLKIVAYAYWIPVMAVLLLLLIISKKKQVSIFVAKYVGYISCGFHVSLKDIQTLFKSIIAGAIGGQALASVRVVAQLFKYVISNYSQKKEISVEVQSLFSEERVYVWVVFCIGLNIAHLSLLHFALSDLEVLNVSLFMPMYTFFLVISGELCGAIYLAEFSNTTINKAAVYGLFLAFLLLLMLVLSSYSLTHATRQKRVGTLREHSESFYVDAFSSQNDLTGRSYGNSIYSLANSRRGNMNGSSKSLHSTSAIPELALENGQNNIVPPRSSMRTLEERFYSIDESSRNEFPLQNVRFDEKSTKIVGPELNVNGNRRNVHSVNEEPVASAGIHDYDVPAPASCIPGGTGLNLKKLLNNVTQGGPSATPNLWEMNLNAGEQYLDAVNVPNGPTTSQGSLPSLSSQEESGIQNPLKPNKYFTTDPELLDFNYPSFSEHSMVTPQGRFNVHAHSGRDRIDSRGEITEFSTNISSTWGDPGNEPAAWNIRGKKYLDDRQKVPSWVSRMKVASMEWLSFPDEPIPCISKLKNGYVQRFHVRREDAELDPNTIRPLRPRPFLFVVNFKVPAFGNYTTYYYPRPGLNDPEFAEQLRLFIEADHDDYRNDRFKIIPGVLKGNFIARKSIGNTPAIIGRKISTTYARGDNWFEVIVDVSTSKIAKAAMMTVKGFASSLVIRFAFLLEGKSEEELPERILGGIDVFYPAMAPRQPVKLTKELI